MPRARHQSMRNLLVLCIAACATIPVPRPKGGPRGLHADEHVAMAEHHDEQARDAAQGPTNGITFPNALPVPWLASWDSAAEHERLAATHRSRAAALEAAYDEACGDRPHEEVSLSPIVRYATGGWNTSSGVILYLSTMAGPADRLLADLNCHRAWMMLQPAESMENCTLDLPGILLDARGDGEGITLSIAVRDPKLVDELHRRAAHDLESGAQHRNRRRE
jgi:hypothetical protein